MAQHHAQTFADMQLFVGRDLFKAGVQLVAAQQVFIVIADDKVLSAVETAEQGDGFGGLQPADIA